MSAVRLTVDEEAQAAYLYLVEYPAVSARTLIIEDGVMVDLDEDGEPRGIELLMPVDVPEMKLLSLRIEQADIEILKEVAAGRQPVLQ